MKGMPLRRRSNERPLSRRLTSPCKGAAALFLLCLACGFISSCGQTELPYLYLTVDESYGEGDIYIPYAFSSESDPQLCRVTLSKRYYDQWITVDETEEYLSAAGEIQFYLYEGDYSLRFSVLSERRGEAQVLTFLDNTYTFSVTR